MSAEAHGMPLSLDNRQAVARSIIDSHPDSSDRSIAALTGLAPGTVAAIRRRSHPDNGDVTARIGRDGRVRPLNPAEGRRIATDAIAKYPDASLREIARMAGISPATVRDVRERLRRWDDPVGSSSRGKALPEGTPKKQTRSPARPARDRTSLLSDLRKDPSLRFTEPGRTLLQWLDARASGPGSGQKIVDAAPPHCAYLVAKLARHCAADWLDFAKQLEQRLKASG